MINNFIFNSKYKIIITTNNVDEYLNAILYTKIFSIDFLHQKSYI